MITARGVLVSSSSSFRLFSPSPPPHRTKRTKECTTSNRIEARDSALRVILSSFAQVLGYASMMHSKTRFPPIIECGSVLSRRGCGRERGEREGEIRSILLVDGEGGGGLYTPFLLIFSRSNSNKWNYGWRRNFQRLSRIRKFPRIMPGHSPDIGDKAFASADIFTGPDSNKTASREFSPPSRRFSRCFGNASFFFPSSSFWNCYSLLIFLNAQPVWSRWRLQQPSNRYRNREKSWERGILCDRIVIITRINEVCWVEKWIYS